MAFVINISSARDSSLTRCGGLENERAKNEARALEGRDDVRLLSSLIGDDCTKMIDHSMFVKLDRHVGKKFTFGWDKKQRSLSQEQFALLATVNVY